MGRSRRGGVRFSAVQWSTAAVLVGALAASSGCGTTRTTNTARSATEQLLISDAVDRAVVQVDFTPLAGQTVYIDESRLGDVVDKSYLASTLRQHMLASGCVLKDKREDAEFIVEPRAGAVGTDNHDLLFGLPAVNVPQTTATAMLPAAIPEIPIAKKRYQRGVAKLAVFAYRRDTGEPVWQSGLVANESTAKDIWLFGAGPFNRGTIYDGTRLAGAPLAKDCDEEGEQDSPQRIAGVHDAAVFPKGLARPAPAPASGVMQATALAPVADEPEPYQVDAADAAIPAMPMPGSPPVLPPPSASSL